MARVGIAHYELLCVVVIMLQLCTSRDGMRDEPFEERQARQLRWHNDDVRVQYNLTGALPCFLHAGGPFKHLLHKITRWWSRQTETTEVRRGNARLAERLLKSKVKCIMASGEDATGC